MAVLPVGRISNPAKRNGRIENPAYAISRWLTRPAPSDPSPTPAVFGLAWEPLECRTVDGVCLAGWVVSPTVRPRATIALFHGFRSNRAQTLDRILFLTAAGFRCVAFDHRAHGESRGQRTSFGFHERHDVLAVMRLSRRLWPAQPCAALGISMGGAAICHAATELRGLHAIILESVCWDIAAAFNAHAGSVFPGWLGQLSRGVIDATERRMGLKMQQLGPGQYVGGLTPTPILFVSREDDPHASAEVTHRLADGYAGPSELWPAARHKDVCLWGNAYPARIVDFLEARLFAEERPLAASRCQRQQC
jgi:pimeloyl-ACP methyl ester carboxylesterase